MRILFLGTPHFAAHCLEKVLESSHKVVAVVTAPDKPAGRGQKLRVSAVKQMALNNNLALLQPPNLKAPDFTTELQSLNIDLAVVVAFRMLPKVVWSLPRLGTINLHASLLPQYRGAAPINWAIINGETETGVTTFFINEEIDTGAILKQQAVPIEKTDNAGSLHDKLVEVGAKLIVSTVNDLESEKIEAQPQTNHRKTKEAPKIFKSHQKIDFNQTAQQVNNLIRGMCPYPAAFTLLKEGEVETVFKIFEAEILEESCKTTAGKLRQTGKKHLDVACKDSWLRLKEVQMAGKKRMSVANLLNGYSFTNEAKFI